MSEKRINPRFGPLVVKTYYIVNGRAGEGYLTNVSTGGAFLAVADPPPLGAEVDFRALLPWRLGELQGGARVVWRNAAASVADSSPAPAPAPPSPPGSGSGSGSGFGEPTSLSGVGLSFTRLDAEAQKRLEAYLARFVELAARIDEL
jgi:PilZ domain